MGHSVNQRKARAVRKGAIIGVATEEGQGIDLSAFGLFHNRMKNEPHAEA